MLLKGTSNIISGICLKGLNFWYINFQEWESRFNYFIKKISWPYYSNKGVNSIQSLAYYSDEDFMCLLTDLNVDIQI